MQVKGDSSLNKLILLFVFDKMEVPLSENTVLDMCCSSNNWLAYMDCQPILNQLLECHWIYNVSSTGDPLYTITPDGRICLANFFINIPASTREEISLFIKNNRTKYRKKQEFVADYFMNKKNYEEDGVEPEGINWAAIIGVVATMTLPALMTNTGEQQARSAVSNDMPQRN